MRTGLAAAVIVLPDARKFAGLFIFFLIRSIIGESPVGTVKAGTLVNDAAAAGDYPVDGLPALGTYRKRGVSHVLHNLKSMVTIVTLIHISRHFNLLKNFFKL
jgi:hypothetical protein